MPVKEGRASDDKHVRSSAFKPDPCVSMLGAESLESRSVRLVESPLGDENESVERWVANE